MICYVLIVRLGGITLLSCVRVVFVMLVLVFVGGVVGVWLIVCVVRVCSCYCGFGGFAVVLWWGWLVGICGILVLLLGV